MWDRTNQPRSGYSDVLGGRRWAGCRACDRGARATVNGDAGAYKTVNGDGDPGTESDSNAHLDGGGRRGETERTDRYKARRCQSDHQVAE